MQDLSPLQQAVDLIRKTKRIGILIPEEADLDQFASAKVIGKILNSIGKTWDFILQPNIKDGWKELPFGYLKPPNDKKDIIISINTADSPIGEIRYEKKVDRLEIIISPKNSPIKKEAVSIEEVKPNFDLLITMGINNLDKIGENLKDPDLIFNTPLINIDYEASNENFGEINIVEKEASSNSEIVFNLIKKLSPEPLDQESATMILAGLIYKIKSLKKNVGPQTALIISELKARGGNEEMITRHLFKTKPLNLLKLWGRASVRSKKEDEKNIFWSFVTSEDFEKTSTSPSDLRFVMDHFEEHFNLPEISIFLWQHPELKSVRAVLRLEKDSFLNELKTAMGGKTTGRYLNTDVVFADFKEAEAKIRSLLS